MKLQSLLMYNDEKEVSDMATKSIYKNIKIKDKSLGQSLASALEDSQAAQTQKSSDDQKVNKIEKENIKKFFGIDKND